MMIASTTALVLLLTITATLPAAAERFQFVGSFADVRSTTGEHCRGYSLDLWKHGERLIGLLDVHRGLCGDPPCGAIAETVLEAKTGRLTFSTSIDGERWTFTGRMTKNAVAGTLNGARVKLPRDRDRDKYYTDFKPDQSLAAWCEFWSGVKRCGGVAELCASLQR